MKSCFVVVTVWRKTYVGNLYSGLLWFGGVEDGVTNDGTVSFKTVEAFW